MEMSDDGGWKACLSCLRCAQRARGQAVLSPAPSPERTTQQVVHLQHTSNALNGREAEQFHRQLHRLSARLGEQQARHRLLVRDLNLLRAEHAALLVEAREHLWELVCAKSTNQRFASRGHVRASLPASFSWNGSKAASLWPLGPLLAGLLFCKPLKQMRRAGDGRRAAPRCSFIPTSGQQG